MDCSEKSFAKRLWGLRPAMAAGALACALCGCSSQLDDVDGMYTPGNCDSVAVAFNAKLADGLAIDHDVIPMRAVWIDGTETQQYNNFKLYSGQLAILKELDDGRYVVYKTLEPVLNAGVPTYLDGKMNLADYLEGADHVYLLPGEYFALLMINGPLDFLEEGEILELGQSIIDEKTYLHSMRGMYYAVNKFTVSKEPQLEEEANGDGSVVDLKVDRLASPVRFIFTTDNKYQKAYGVKIEMDIMAESTEIPIGMDIEGNYMWSNSGNIKIENKMTVVNTKMNNAAEDVWYMFPTYAEKDVSVPTSPFLFTRFDDKNEITVDFNIQKLYLTVSGEVIYSGSLLVEDVKLKPDCITNVVLNYSSKDGSLVYSVNEEVLNGIKEMWSANYPEIPFNYIEYN